MNIYLFLLLFFCIAPLAGASTDPNSIFEPMDHVYETLRSRLDPTLSPESKSDRHCAIIREFFWGPMTLLNLGKPEILSTETIDHVGIKDENQLMLTISGKNYLLDINQEKENLKHKIPELIAESERKIIEQILSDIFLNYSYDLHLNWGSIFNLNLNEDKEETKKIVSNIILPTIFSIIKFRFFKNNENIENIEIKIINGKDQTFSFILNPKIMQKSKDISQLRLLLDKITTKDTNLEPQLKIAKSMIIAVAVSAPLSETFGFDENLQSLNYRQNLFELFLEQNMLKEKQEINTYYQKNYQYMTMISIKIILILIRSGKVQNVMQMIHFLQSLHHAEKFLFYKKIMQTKSKNQPMLPQLNFDGLLLNLLSAEFFVSVDLSRHELEQDHKFSTQEKEEQDRASDNISTQLANEISDFIDFNNLEGTKHNITEDRDLKVSQFLRVSLLIRILKPHEEFKNYIEKTLESMRCKDKNLFFKLLKNSLEQLRKFYSEYSLEEKLMHPGLERTCFIYYTIDKYFPFSTQINELISTDSGSEKFSNKDGAVFINSNSESSSLGKESLAISESDLSWIDEKSSADKNKNKSKHRKRSKNKSISSQTSFDSDATENIATNDTNLNITNSEKTESSDIGLSKSELNTIQNILRNSNPTQDDFAKAFALFKDKNVSDKERAPLKKWLVENFENINSFQERTLKNLLDISSLIEELKQEKCNLKIYKIEKLIQEKMQRLKLPKKIIVPEIKIKDKRREYVAHTKKLQNEIETKNQTIAQNWKDYNKQESLLNLGSKLIELCEQILDKPYTFPTISQDIAEIRKKLGPDLCNNYFSQHLHQYDKINKLADIIAKRASIFLKSDSSTYSHLMSSGIVPYSGELFFFPYPPIDLRWETWWRLQAIHPYFVIQIFKSFLIQNTNDSSDDCWLQRAINLFANKTPLGLNTEEFSVFQKEMEKHAENMLTKMWQEPNFCEYHNEYCQILDFPVQNLSYQIYFFGSSINGVSFRNLPDLLKEIAESQEWTQNSFANSEDYIRFNSTFAPRLNDVTALKFFSKDSDLDCGLFTNLEGFIRGIFFFYNEKNPPEYFPERKIPYPMNAPNTINFFSFYEYIKEHTPQYSYLFKDLHGFLEDTQKSLGRKIEFILFIDNRGLFAGDGIGPAFETRSNLPHTTWKFLNWQIQEWVDISKSM